MCHLCSHEQSSPWPMLECPPTPTHPPATPLTPPHHTLMDARTHSLTQCRARGTTRSTVEHCPTRVPSKCVAQTRLKNERQGGVYAQSFLLSAYRWAPAPFPWTLQVDRGFNGVSTCSPNLLLGLCARCLMSSSCSLAAYGDGHNFHAYRNLFVAPGLPLSFLSQSLVPSLVRQWFSPLSKGQWLFKGCWWHRRALLPGGERPHRTHLDPSRRLAAVDMTGREELKSNLALFHGSHMKAPPSQRHPQAQCVICRSCQWPDQILMKRSVLVQLCMLPPLLRARFVSGACCCCLSLLEARFEECSLDCAAVTVASPSFLCMMSSLSVFSNRISVQR